MLKHSLDELKKYKEGNYYYLSVGKNISSEITYNNLLNQVEFTYYNGNKSHSKAFEIINDNRLIIAFLKASRLFKEADKRNSCFVVDQMIQMFKKCIGGELEIIN